MTPERIKEIQQATAYPESISVQQALLQVWNECEQEQVKNCSIDGIISCLASDIEELHYQSRERDSSYLKSLLIETKSKGNLAMELIYALETYLNK